VLQTKVFLFLSFLSTPNSYSKDIKKQLLKKVKSSWCFYFILESLEYFKFKIFDIFYWYLPLSNTLINCFHSQRIYVFIF